MSFVLGFLRVIQHALAVIKVLRELTSFLQLVKEVGSIRTVAEETCAVFCDILLSLCCSKLLIINNYLLISDRFAVPLIVPCVYKSSTVCVRLCVIVSDCVS